MRGIWVMRWRPAFLVLAVTLVGSFAFAGVASAANTCTVNDQRDLPQEATKTTPASTGGPTDFTIRSCFAWANEQGGAWTIGVPAGTYPIDSATAGPGDLTTGDFKVNPANNSTAITLTGAGSGSTVINAQGNDRSLEVWPNGVLNVSGFTLENGTSGSTSKHLQHDDGGAIDSEGHLTVSNVTFTGNTASAGGGAIEAEDNSGSTLSVTGSVFQNNSTGDGGGAIATISPNDVTVSFSLLQANTAGVAGGGIVGCASSSSFCPATSAAAGLTLNFDDFVQNVSDDVGGGGVAWAGQGAVNITNSLFTQNQATGVDGFGGAIGNVGTANFNISNTSFDGNSALDGGAMFDGASNGLNLTQDKFSGNTASGEGGGALLLAANTNGVAANGTYTAITTITSSEFDGNQATGSGAGGAIAWIYGPLSLLGDSFVLNSAANGGALFTDANASKTDGGLLTMIDSTMSRNTASADGGAILNDAKAGQAATITNDTIAFNNAGTSGGGVQGANAYGSGGSQATGFGIENTTVAENSGGDCGSSGKFSVSGFDVGHNNDSDQTCFGGVGGPNDLVGVNPLLANPANNGGPAAGGPGDTETIQTDAEQASSPTVDAGNNNGCPPVDERAVTRPQGKACDIGAFEFGASSGTSTTTATTTTGGTTTTSVTTTKTTSTKPKTTRCPKGKHKSRGKCVKNKPKKKKCPKGKVRKHGKCVKKHK